MATISRVVTRYWAQVKQRPLLTILLWVLITLSSFASAQYVVIDEGKLNEEASVATDFWLPYAFYSDSLGLGYGVAGALMGYGQEQAGLGGALMASTNGAKAVYLLASNYQLPGSDRWFFDSRLAAGWFNQLRGYYSPSELSDSEGFGSNDSKQDDYVEGDGIDNLLELDFSYVLPIGAATSTAIHSYHLTSGRLIASPLGGDLWNPLQSGRSKVIVKPFVQNRSYVLEDQEPEFHSNGLEILLTYDNRDYEINPSRGSYQSIAYKQDFGWFDSSDSWNTVELDLRKYIQTQWLGSQFEQEVIALRAWWVDTPSWQSASASSSGEIEHRPPHFMGATLGGVDRMKAYPSARFNDKSAVYYAAEYRVTPRWNPFSNIPLPMNLRADWWQLTTFIEAGRVNEHWDWKTLHSDLQLSAGVGSRFYIADVVIRLDAAFSDETSQFWVMAGQTY